MKRVLLSLFAALTLGGSIGGCYASHPEYTDVYGRPYRHEHYKDQDVWQREDGRWYARHNNDWVVRGDVVIH
jgi:hypothetical protein